MAEDLQLQIKQLQELCKQAEELQRAAKQLCDNLTERVERTSALLHSSPASDRRKKAR
jgi:hypothetical protein